VTDSPTTRLTWACRALPRPAALRGCAPAGRAPSAESLTSSSAAGTLDKLGDSLVAHAFAMIIWNSRPRLRHYPADGARRPAALAIAPKARSLRRHEGLVDLPSGARQQQAGGRPRRETADTDGAYRELRHASHFGETADCVAAGWCGAASRSVRDEGYRPNRRSVPRSPAGGRAGDGTLVRDRDRVTLL